MSGYIWQDLTFFKFLILERIEVLYMIQSESLHLVYLLIVPLVGLSVWSTVSFLIYPFFFITEILRVFKGQCQYHYFGHLCLDWFLT